MLDMHLNNLIMKKKLFLLYFCCVMLPLVVTDTVIVGIIVKNEYDTKQERMKNDISSVEYTLNTAAEEAVSLSKNIYFNKYINNFLNTEFESPLDYYNQYQDLLRDSLFDSSLGTSNAIITMYADNLTLVNGGKFWKINSIENQEWYGEFHGFRPGNADIFFIMMITGQQNSHLCGRRLLCADWTGIKRPL